MATLGDKRSAVIGVLAAGAVAVLVLAGCAATDSVASSTEASAAAPSTLVDTSAHLVRPTTVHVGDATDVAANRHMVHLAQRLYTFWNTGDATYLDNTVAPGFTDRTLPAGRAQGRAGLLQASTAFRTAVPDLTCDLADLYITGDTLTARLVFTGHFTGTRNGVHGAGQPIRFSAIDIQHAANGSLITQDWHLEDKLTFLQQAGLVSIAGG